MSDVNVSLFSRLRLAYHAFMLHEYLGPYVAIRDQSETNHVFPCEPDGFPGYDGCTEKTYRHVAIVNLALRKEFTYAAPCKRHYEEIFADVRAGG